MEATQRSKLDAKLDNFEHKFAGRLRKPKFYKQLEVSDLVSTDLRVDSSHLSTSIRSIFDVYSKHFRRRLEARDVMFDVDLTWLRHVIWYYLLICVCFFDHESEPRDLRARAARDQQI
jgi:hypothetical protein